MTSEDRGVLQKLILPSVFLLLMSAAAAAEDVALVFTRPGCPPCEQLHAAISDDPSLFAGYRLEEIDPSEYRSIALQYGVKSVPTIVILRAGRPVRRRTGYESADELREWLDNAKQRGRRWRK